MPVVRLGEPLPMPHKSDAELGLSTLAGLLLRLMVNMGSNCVTASQDLPHSEEDLGKCSPVLSSHILTLNPLSHCLSPLDIKWQQQLS